MFVFVLLYTLKFYIMLYNIKHNLDKKLKALFSHLKNNGGLKISDSNRPTGETVTEQNFM